MYSAFCSAVSLFFPPPNCKGAAFPQEQHVSTSNGPFLPHLFNAYTVDRCEAACIVRGEMKENEWDSEWLKHCLGMCSRDQTPTFHLSLSILDMYCT